MLLLEMNLWKCNIGFQGREKVNKSPIVIYSWKAQLRSEGSCPLSHGWDLQVTWQSS